MKKLKTFLALTIVFSILASLTIVYSATPGSEGEWSLIDIAKQVILDIALGSDCNDATHMCSYSYSRGSPSSCCRGWCSYQNKWQWGSGILVRTHWPAKTTGEEFYAYSRHVWNPFCRDTDMYINVTSPNGRSSYGGNGLIYTTAWAGPGTYTVDFITGCIDTWHTQVQAYWTQPICVHAAPI